MRSKAPIRLPTELSSLAKSAGTRRAAPQRSSTERSEPVCSFKRIRVRRLARASLVEGGGRRVPTRAARDVFRRLEALQTR